MCGECAGWLEAEEVGSCIGVECEGGKEGVRVGAAGGGRFEVVGGEVGASREARRLACTARREVADKWKHGYTRCRSF